MVANRCQYWNVYEPLQCIYWNATSFACDYVTKKTEDLMASLEAGEILDVNIVSPDYAPYCNYIGTMVTCSNYKSSNPGVYQPRCMLPDPTRHVCNRWTGKKWVSISLSDDVTEEGASITTAAPDFSPINGYNEGTCDGAGTDTTCSGYTPSHMGFGRLLPSSDGTRDTYKEVNTFSTIMEFDYRLPLHFTVFNLRAKLSKCMWWFGDYTPFTVNSGTRMIELGGDWLCTNENDVSCYEHFGVETGAPCNGAKPDCPYYSGICWEYCVDDLMKSGDPVLAEQVHELRYYCKENQWTADLFKHYFGDQGYIYTWAGSHSIKSGAGVLHGDFNYTVSSKDNSIEEYEIPSVKTHMSDFNTLTVEHEDLVLTQGTEVDDKLLNFPNKVTEFSLIQLSPIIKNRFETDGVFEVSCFGDVDITLYGKVFTGGTVFAINISHIDVYSSIPKELFTYDSLLDIRLDKGTTSYNEFYSHYVNTITLLKKIVVSSDNINSLTDTYVNSFLLKAPLYPKKKVANGINTIAVFQESPDGLLFAKINIEKNIVGGALMQTEFVINGDEKPIRTPYDYTKGFFAQVNKGTGRMSFEFVSFNTAGKVYNITQYYDDSNFGEMGGTSTYSGFKYYKIIIENYPLTGPSEVSEGYTCEYFPLGDDGYFLIVLNIIELNRVFQPWEVEKIIATYDDGSSCEFEIVCSGADDLTMEVNQFIIKPKDKNAFKSICSAVLSLENLVFYDKRSFDEEPPYPWKYELLNGGTEENPTNFNKITYTANVSDNKIVVTDFQFIMTPSVVIANSAGRPFSLFRTKPIGWVKQPQCPAVEIKYSWSAEYTHWHNVPVCTCCGPASSQGGEPSGFSLSPPCGDHDISKFTGIGPMWWPFTACESYTTYDIVSNLDNYSLDVIGLFKEKNEDGVKLHGDHDMRMLGPANNIAYHGRGCNFLMACRCNWRTYNNYKNSDNVFIGYGRIRSGVESYQLAEWLEDGGVLPKFGNPFRPQLDSYLTLDKIQYLYTADGTNWTVDWKLMPAFMGFSKADFLDTKDAGLWSYNASDMDNTAPVCNPLGFFRAFGFEGVSINETIDYKNRFTLDEICHARVTVDGIRYPDVLGEYTSSKKEGKIYPWYEFKQYNPPKTAENLAEDGESSRTIQWAWQEKWSSLERFSGENVTKSAFIRSFLTKSLNDSEDDTPTLGGPFIVGDDGNVGIFKFLDITYPSYKYNYKTEEFTTVIDEGYHYIKLIAPKRDPFTGEYNGYVKIQLDDGPIRGISWNAKDWLDEDNQSNNISIDIEDYNLDVYEKFTGQLAPELSGGVEKSWFDEVTLFDSNCPLEIDGAEQAAEDEGRMVESYTMDEEGALITKKLHYQRGLNVSVVSSSFLGTTLPTEVIAVGANPDEQNYVGNDGDPIVSLCGLGEVVAVAASFDNKVKSITAVDITFSYGATVDESLQVEGKPTVYKYYHLPAITVYSSSDGVTKDSVLYNNPTMTLCVDSSLSMVVTTKTYAWDNTIDYLFAGSAYVIVEVRTTPTETELAALSEAELLMYNKSKNYVSFKIFEMYEAIFTDAYEPLTTWERKYYVSYGNSGGSPPQGVDPENTTTLWARGAEKSTPYTRDCSDGVLNIDGSDADKFTIMSKVRGRILGKLYKDGEVLSGDVWEMEGKQKELFDEAVEMSDPYNVMEPITIPSLSKYLDEESICFYGNYFTLENTLPFELAEINRFDPMSGEGQQYIANYMTLDYKCVPPLCNDGGALSSMEWVFTSMDEDSQFTGQGYASAFVAYYGGTASYMDRKALSDALIENVFGKQYGGSTETKIWASDSETELLFPTLSPLYLDTVDSSVSISYNMTYLTLSMNWHNAYFNTAENFAGSPSTVVY